MIISHRGRNNSSYPENTLEAFEFAIKSGAEAIECDLRLTLDNETVVSHDDKIIIGSKKFRISKTPLRLLMDISGSQKRILTIDELFVYIKNKNMPFFLEVKSGSFLLIKEIVKKVEKDNLWSRVYILGFSAFIKAALNAQVKYPKLRVVQIVANPLCYLKLKIPIRSYGIFIGWIDQWRGTQWFFRRFMSTDRLIKLKKFYEKKDFKVMAGVINNLSGMEYFKKAGIENMVTDNVSRAKTILRESVL